MELVVLISYIDGDLNDIYCVEYESQEEFLIDFQKEVETLKEKREMVCTHNITVHTRHNLEYHKLPPINHKSRKIKEKELIEKFKNEFRKLPDPGLNFAGQIWNTNTIRADFTNIECLTLQEWFLRKIEEHSADQ